MVQPSVGRASPDTGAGDPTPRVRPFVGRDAELAELRSALAEGAAGRGSTLLVCGEPGIGKSRLTEELAAGAAADGWRVLSGRCWDGGGAPAYWPWVQVVRAAGGEFDRLAPVLEAAAATGRRPGVSESSDPEAARFELFDQVGRFLSDAASRSPCLVVLDDLHAADEPSLLLLRFLAATMTGRVVVVGTYRERELRVHELAELFGELTRLGRRISLRGLTAGEIATYVSLLVGHPPAAAVADRVHDVTGGNPFFVGEVVRALIADGVLDRAGEAATLRLPEEVRALIRRRVAGLTPESVNALRVASVVGRDFDLRAVMPTSRLSIERLVDALSEAVRAGVIVEDADVAGQYAFAHDLVRETLYNDLPGARRMELHRTVGRILEERFAGDLDPHLAEIAHHFAQAAPLGEEARATDYLTRAADRAAALLAYEDAAELYARAVQLAPPRETSVDERCELLLRLGDAQSRTGDADAPQRTFGEAAAIARRSGAPELLARAALGFVSGAVPVRLGLGGLLLAARFEVGATGIALLEEALEALPAEDGPLRARVLARLATELYTTDQTDRRLALSQEALDMALRLGDPEALVEALHGRHWATLAPGSVRERLANAHQMLMTATGAGDAEAAFLARHARLHCFLELGEVQEMDAEIDAMASLADRIRQPFYRWHAACTRAMRSLLEGRLVEAEAQVEAALGIGRVRESRFVRYMHEHAQIVAIRWSQGRLDEVRASVREHGDRYRGIARWRDALVAAELGDERAARAELDRHGHRDFADLPRDGLWIIHLSALAQDCALLRDRERATTLYELLEPYADRIAISVSTVPFGPVAMRLGMLATVLERWDEAERHFELAASRCAALGARPALAMVQIEHARMRFARGEAGDARRAAELLAEAVSTCEEFDLPGVLARARALAPAPADAGPAPTRAVLRREGQFWTVAYGGELARLRDLKGLRYLTLLLAAPGRDLHVLEIVRAAEGTSSAAGGVEELPVSRLERSDPILDAAGKETFRRRLHELAEELEEARAWNDPERATRTELEIDALTTELERGLGLGGRDRGLSSPAERARVSVTKALRAAVRAISKDCPGLGEHLRVSVRTGRFCSYAPPGQTPPTWNT